MEKQNVETIKMVDRALEVLDILRKERSPLGVNEIAKNCELNPSTAFRILKTLEVNGWVYQCMDGRYITGQKISFVIEKNNLYLALKEVAELTMSRCTEENRQAMNLVVREGSRCYIQFLLLLCVFNCPRSICRIKKEETDWTKLTQTSYGAFWIS